MTTTSEGSVCQDNPPDGVDFASLLEFGTATLHEVAGAGTVLPPAIVPVVPGFELSGRAFTVTTSPGDNLWIHRAIYAAPPDSVLVISCGDGYEFGYWGEILSTAAVERRLAGVVIDGFVRDSVALGRVGFPVFARGLCVRGTGKEPGDGSGLGMRLRLGDAMIDPGDLVVGDADGAISIPPRSYPGLLDRATERVAKEELIMDGLRHGGRSIDLLNLEPREKHMAKIVFGFGTSHSSQLSLSPDDWPEQAELDKERTPWDDLVKAAPDSIQDDLAPEVQHERHARAQQALRTLTAAIEEHRPDVLLIVGDDQDELFPHDQLVPAVALALTPSLIDRPVDLSKLPPIRRKSMWAMHGEVEEEYPIDAALSEHVATHLAGHGFDVAVLRSQPETRGLGHAWTFVRRRILGDIEMSMVPVFLNTYFAPNRPTPARCVELGAALAAAVEGYPEDTRVGLVASGGLSHFVIDEALDRRVLDALKAGDAERLAAESPETFTSGTSEILNWITVGSALREQQFDLIDYLPAYRSLAGTGCGFAFGVWTPQN